MPCCSAPTRHVSCGLANGPRPAFPNCDHTEFRTAFQEFRQGAPSITYRYPSGSSLLLRLGVAGSKSNTIFSQVMPTIQLVSSIAAADRIVAEFCSDRRQRLGILPFARRGTRGRRSRRRATWSFCVLPVLPVHSSAADKRDCNRFVCISVVRHFRVGSS